MSDECSCKVCGRHHLWTYNKYKDYCSICGETFDKPIKELMIKYISTFGLEQLINIINHKSGICIECKQHAWLEPPYKHAFWGCKISTIKFEKHFYCHGKKFEPNKSFLKKLQE